MKVHLETWPRLEPGPCPYMHKERERKGGEREKEIKSLKLDYWIVSGRFGGSHHPAHMSTETQNWSIDNFVRALINRQNLAEGM